MRVTPTAVEFDDPGGNNVEEVSVMCDKNYCAWKPLEKLFEPADLYQESSPLAYCLNRCRVAVLDEHARASVFAIRKSSDRLPALWLSSLS